jgi:hypothetical protein
LVVNNATLSNVQKFHYLIASLQDEANGLISNLQITNENFLVAWHLLTQRYNNIRVISMMHAKNLCQIPHVKKGDALSLRRLINNVSSNTNALQALSLNVTVQDLMVDYLILASLDDQSQRDWELATASCADIPTSADLIAFLETGCQALELIQSNQLVRALPALPRSSQPADRKVSKHTYSNVATQLQCSLCNESHSLFKCDKFLRMQPRQRLSHVKQLNLCFNCLQIYSKNHQCSRQLCRQCNKRHHTLLHIDKQSQTRDKGSTTNNSLVAETRSSTNEELNTYCSLKGQAKNHVLLATAIVEVQNKFGQYIPCRALLDSASQSHFITERCVQRLRLTKTQTHAAIHGISNVNTATHHSLAIHLRSRLLVWHTTLNCAILPNITGVAPSAKLDISSWKLPKDIKLADEQFYKPGGIALIIDADIFYEILRAGQRTRQGNFPVLQGTTHGWTISVRTPAITQEPEPT